MSETTIRLPMDASVADIAAAIRRIETGLPPDECTADPEHVAHHVRRQLDRAERMAEVVGMTVQDLDPRGMCWWGPTCPDGPVTVVYVVGDALLVARRTPPVGARRDASLLLLLPWRDA